MSLFVKGEKDKIREYRNRAEKDGLKIIFYSEETNTGKLELFPGTLVTEHENIDLSRYSATALKMLIYLQEKQQKGVEFVKQSDFTTKLKMPKATVSIGLTKLESDKVIARYSLDSHKRGYTLKLIKKISEEDYNILKSALK